MCVYCARRIDEKQEKIWPPILSACPLVFLVIVKNMVLYVLVYHYCWYLCVFNPDIINIGAVRQRSKPRVRSVIRQSFVIYFFRLFDHHYTNLKKCDKRLLVYYSVPPYRPAPIRNMRMKGCWFCFCFFVFSWLRQSSMERSNYVRKPVVAQTRGVQHNFFNFFMVSYQNHLKY